jgi:hypothetical protein
MMSLTEGQNGRRRSFRKKVATERSISYSQVSPLTHPLSALPSEPSCFAAALRRNRFCENHRLPHVFWETERNWVDAAAATPWQLYSFLLAVPAENVVPVDRESMWNVSWPFDRVWQTSRQRCFVATG